MRSDNAAISYCENSVETPEENSVPATVSSVKGAQKAIYRLLSRIEKGELLISDHQGRQVRFGKKNSEQHAHCKVHHPQFFSKLLCGGSLALGESYMDGWWEIADDRLADFFRIIFQNKLEFAIEGSLSLRMYLFLQRILVSPRRLGAAKRSVAAHYDLGNGLFKHMLDESMTYSCGYAKTESDSLKEMQQQKYERIYQKLGLSKGGSLVDIGCGWGGMLAYAARKNPAITGVGITLSTEQYEFARARLRTEGLSDRIKIYLSDYRQFNGSYDFLVSIGMFEHVGRESYPIFFEKAAELLKPGGIGLLHTIGLEEEPDIKPDPWVGKYIFPGSRLPRLEELSRELRAQSFTVGHVENLRPHYAITLRKWRKNFVDNWREIKSHGYDERFYRMWNYYLQISEACFCDSTMELYQVLFCKGNAWRFPLRFEFERPASKRLAAFYSQR